MHIEVRGTTQKDLDVALRKFNTMIKKSEIMEELYHRKEYMKPSKKKQWKRKRAVVKKIRHTKALEKKNRKLNTHLS